jgi:hypothetical protein
MSYVACKYHNVAFKWKITPKYSVVTFIITTVHQKSTREKNISLEIKILLALKKLDFLPARRKPVYCGFTEWEASCYIS